MMPLASRPVLLVLALLLAACGARRSVLPGEPASPSRRPPAGPRLPDSVRPTGYSAELTVDPASPTFHGLIEVALELREPTELLWLHGRRLQVKEATLRVGGEELPATLVQGGESRLGVLAPRPLPAGEARLRLTYEGLLPEQEVSGGFRTREGEDWYVFTQFQPLGARQVFPCFDEPSFKVPWQLTLHVPEGLVAVSNTPELSREPRAGGGSTFRFAPTPPLPSYLIAFGVGPFDFLQAPPSGQRAVPTRIITPRGRAAEGAYAAQVTPEILGHLERDFGMPYPYQKLDVLAVPHLGGAMEHPGLITFAPELLLAREGEDGPRRQRRFYALQVHELAHQWFGNLVTLAWWDDLWLNESFATWMVPRLLEEARPSWEGPLERVRMRSSALEADALVSARQLRQPIRSEDDILGAFDAITYDKGASVLAMTEEWLGREVFRAGLRRYLRTHAEGTATARDFLEALGAEAGQDVSGVLGTFLEQGGAPLVSAELDCQGERPVVRLSQRRYLPVGSAGKAGQVWKVPLCVRYGTDTEVGRVCTVLERETAELPLEAAHACPSWLLPNAEGAGYMRARLEGPALLRLLTQAPSPLSRAERVALLGDTKALVKAGALPAEQALALLPALAEEEDRPVLEAALGLVELLSLRLLPQERWADRARFLRETFGARARTLGLLPRAGEDENTRMLRPLLVELAGVQGEEPGLEAQARALAVRWLEDRDAVPPDMVATVLELATRRGGADMQRRLLEALSREQAPAVRRQLFRALSTVEEPELVHQQLGMLLEPEVDPREVVGLLMGASTHSRTRELAYTFVQENYEALAQRLPEQFLALLPMVGVGFCDPEHRQDLEAFFSERSARIPGGEPLLAQALEEVDLCIALEAAQGRSVEAFLDASRGQ